MWKSLEIEREGGRREHSLFFLASLYSTLCCKLFCSLFTPRCAYGGGGGGGISCRHGNTNLPRVRALVRAPIAAAGSSRGTRVAALEGGRGLFPLQRDAPPPACLPARKNSPEIPARSRTRSLELAASVPHLSSSSFCYCRSFNSSSPSLSPPLPSAPSVCPSCGGLTHSAPPLSIAPTHCCSAWEPCPPTCPLGQQRLQRRRRPRANLCPPTGSEAACSTRPAAQVSFMVAVIMCHSIRDVTGKKMFSL